MQIHSALTLAHPAYPFRLSIFLARFLFPPFVFCLPFMLHIDQARSKKWLVAFLVVSAAGAAWWAWHSSTRASGDESGSGAFPWSRAEPSGASSNKPLSADQGQALIKQTAEPIRIDQRPSFLSEEEWGALREALREDPNREQEMVRILEYLRFQKQFEAWQALKNSPDAAQRQALAAELMDQIPQRLEKRELGAGEAQMLQTILIEDMVADPQARQARLAQERQRLASVSEKTDVAAKQQDEAQLKQYKQREAEIIAQWQAMPVEQRDQHWLESQLDAARRATYEGR